MYAYPWSKPLLAAFVLCGLAGCGKGNDGPVQPSQEQSFIKGWSHNCTLICTNVSVNQPETVERPGRMGHATGCQDSKQACETARAEACANAVGMTNNETLYDDCRVVGEGECVEGCAIRR